MSKISPEVELSLAQFELVKKNIDFLRKLCDNDVRLIYTISNETAKYSELNLERWFTMLSEESEE